MVLKRLFLKNKKFENNKIINNLKIKTNIQNIFADFIIRINNSRSNTVATQYSNFLFNVGKKLKELNLIKNIFVVISKEKKSNFKRIIIIKNNIKLKIKGLFPYKIYSLKNIESIKEKYLFSKNYSFILCTTSKGILTIDESKTLSIGGKIIAIVN